MGKTTKANITQKTIQDIDTGQSTHQHLGNIICHQGNVRENHNEILIHIQ